MFEGVQIISEGATRVKPRAAGKEEGPIAEYDAISAMVNGRRVNVYFPLDDKGGHSGTVIIDRSTQNNEAVFGKDGFFDQIKPNAKKRQMTPGQIAEENLKLRAYQILTESNFSLWRRATTSKLSNGWSATKSGVSWAKDKTVSGFNSSKEFYQNHPVAFKRLFLSTACTVMGLVGYYIQLRLNPIGIGMNHFQTTPLDLGVSDEPVYTEPVYEEPVYE